MQSRVDYLEFNSPFSLENIPSRVISETTKSLYYELYEDENEANPLDEISLRTSANQIIWRTGNAETIS